MPFALRTFVTAESWRKLFAAPGEEPTDLPFYYVQMQRCGSYMSPDVRDDQYRSYFTIPNAGMAVLLDLDVNLHPANKYDAGRRLALWSLKKDYGKDVVYSGPLYRSSVVVGNAMRLHFNHGQGLRADGELANFTMAGADGVFHPATAKIEGETIVVTCDQVARPASVRYCWGTTDEGNLFTGAGLPASSFRTDGWPPVSSWK